MGFCDACTTSWWGLLTIIHTGYPWAKYYRSGLYLNLYVTLVSLNMFVGTSVNISAAAEQWLFLLCTCSKIRPFADATVVYVLKLRLEVCQTGPGERRACKTP